MTAPPRVLTIAGSDCSGGAGIQADIKTITMLGGYAMTAITAITVQNSVGVQAVEVIAPALVAAQIDSCLNDIGVDAIKIGMLGSPATAAMVAERVATVAVPIVFDPVMVATSGGTLADRETVAVFEKLMDLATLTTPNIHELAALGGPLAMAERAVVYLAKGGDGDGSLLEDRLVQPGREDRIWRDSRIETQHTHGTGCTLSSAIATHLGAGLTLEAAIERARQFVRATLFAAPGFGQGHGPLGHAAVRD